MSNAAFFAAIRPLFGGALSQSQVDGVNHILSATKGLPKSHRAYLLATCFHETGSKMAPNRESLNYSVNGLLKTFSRKRISAADAKRLGRSGSRQADQRAIANLVYGGEWGRENLGNVKPNDGWDFRGGGQAHTTGRTNFEKVREATGVDVVNHPDRILDPKISAIALVQASVDGWYTGKKLSDYLPGDYFNARRVINGTDKADVIAAYARSFENALNHFDYDEPDTPVGEPFAVTNPLAAFFALLARIFGAKK